MPRLIDANTLRAEFTGNVNGGYYTVPEIRATIDAAPTIGGWISVKDRLPEERINPLTQDFAEVICFCDFGGEPRRTDVRTYKFGKPTWEKDGHFLHGGQIMDGVITHWQYLPEPPKEGKE